MHVASWQSPLVIRSARFVLILFVPVLLALLAGAALSFFAAQHARGVQSELSQELSADLSMAAEAASISHELWEVKQAEIGRASCRERV